MAVATTTGAPGRTDLDWGVARGIAGFRWLALGWAAVVFVLTRADVQRAYLGWALLAAALVVTTLTTEASIRRRPGLFHPAAVVVEVAVGVSMLLADGAVYDRSDHSQSLGSAWPLAGVLAAATLLGPIGGGVAGSALGASRWLGNRLSHLETISSLALFSSGVLYVIAGTAAGAVWARVQQAETAIARGRAREEVSRTLHDGVLQTLAVVQRRVPDGELAALAREQELELRAFLAGDRPQLDQLGAALRHVAARVERRDGLRVEVLLVDEDHPTVSPMVVEALAGAVGEALTNAAKHGEAARAIVFVDVEDRVFCSIKDDGKGFDPAEVSEGLGTGGSIRGRLTEVGGTVTVVARPGAGVEVQLEAPLRSKRTG